MNASPDFGAIVRDYERLTEPVTSVVARQALDLVKVAPGQRVIDVAAGTGALAVAAAAQGALVLATDIAPPMVARAAERLRPFPGCEARVMDLGDLDVADATFDAAFSIFGVMMFAGWEQGLRELVRVTRPGGCITVTAWTQWRDQGPAMLLRRVFAETFPGRELWPEGFFPLWSQDSFAAAVGQAGCADVAVQVCRSVWRERRLSGVADSLQPVLRLFPGYAALAETERADLGAPIEAALAAYTAPDGSIAVPALAHVGTGRKAA